LSIDSQTEEIMDESHSEKTDLGKDENSQSFWKWALDRINYPWISFSLIAISLIVVVLGLILFYCVAAVSEMVGFWLIVAGVILFLLVLIFGFQKFD
jgi:hypothetical protein